MSSTIVSLLPVPSSFSSCTFMSASMRSTNWSSLFSRSLWCLSSSCRLLLLRLFLVREFLRLPLSLPPFLWCSCGCYCAFVASVVESVPVVLSRHRVVSAALTVSSLGSVLVIPMIVPVVTSAIITSVAIVGLAVVATLVLFEFRSFSPVVLAVTVFIPSASFVRLVPSIVGKFPSCRIRLRLLFPGLAFVL